MTSGDARQNSVRTKDRDSEEQSKQLASHLTRDPSDSITYRRFLRVRAYVVMTKPRVMELLLVTTVPTMVLAHGGLPNLPLMVATLIGGAASSGSASAFNMYLDRDMDARMRRTSGRPLVTGEVTPRSGLIFAWLLAISSTVWFWCLLNYLAAALSVCAILWYVVVYTILLKRRTEQNIVWGGIAGCFPVLIGWASETGTLSWPAVILFLVIFFWTPAHYWPLSVKYGEDYRSVSVPMLGAIHGIEHVAKRVIAYAVVTAMTSILLIPIAGMSWTYAMVAVVGGSWFVWEALRLRAAARRAEAAARPMRMFVVSNAYLALLFAAVAIDTLVKYRLS
ncbi:heme o synthase [Streptomyces malaysiensis]|uniref:heme o synthase n=1 Tax=Streptomyces malaysiensis TaxID=92644 RepID=UPI000C9CFE65|nr:heme o synthase [Streptomyces malaysiensis]